MPEDRGTRRLIALGSAGVLIGLAVLLGIEVFWPSDLEETAEGQAAEIVGLAVVIASLATVVVSWMKHGSDD